MGHEWEEELVINPSYLDNKLFFCKLCGYAMHRFDSSPPPVTMVVTVAAAKITGEDTEDLAYLSCEEYQAYRIHHG